MSAAHRIDLSRVASHPVESIEAAWVDGERLTEADLDARQRERDTPIGCSGACEGGRAVCDCGARPAASWREIFDTELSHPWWLAVYAAALVGAIAASAVWPWGWGIAP